jgi:D-alanyl-D-alanine carboxypeptidase
MKQLNGGIIMREKLNLILQKGLQNGKFVLKRGKVICIVAFISITSMSCKSTSVDGYTVTVMNPKLLENVDSTNIGSDEIEEVVSKNVVTPIPTVTPTPMPTATPTLTPEQEELQKYDNYFKLYDYCYIEANHDRYIAYFKKNPDMPALDAITYVNIGLDNDYYTNVTDIVNPSSPLVICNKYNKLPNNYVPEGFSKDTLKTTVLHGDAGEAYEKMIESAKRDGLKIYSISSYRSYQYQEERYNAKVRARGQADVDKTNARPGNSEHQTAKAADFISLDESFANTREGQWLFKNAYKFGYILRYPKGKEKITGYNYEPWHYRYVGVKIATVIHKSGLTYDEFYARYIEKVVLEHPEVSYLSGDEFYDKYLSKYFIKGQVFIDQASMDEDLVNDINTLLDAMSVSSNNEYAEEEEEVLVKVA